MLGNKELVEDGTVEEEYVQVSDPESGSESATPTPQGKLSNDVQKIPASKKSGLFEDYYNTASVHPITPSPYSGQNLRTSTEETNANESSEIPTDLTGFLNGISQTITNGASNVSKTLATGWHDFLEGMEGLTEEFESFNIQQAFYDTRNTVSSLATVLALEEIRDRIGSDTPQQEAAQAIVDLCETAEYVKARKEMRLAMVNVEIAATEEVVKDTAKKLDSLNSGIKGDKDLRAYQSSIDQNNTPQEPKAPPQQGTNTAKPNKRKKNRKKMQ